MENNSTYRFLSSFFALFKADINDFKTEGKKVSGSIEWKNENERQAFSWVVDLDDSVLEKVKMLCDYLVSYHLIHGDKITISESELSTKLQDLGWSLEEAGENIDYLCSIEVKMIDDGEETDSFFVHF